MSICDVWMGVDELLATLAEVESGSLSLTDKAREFLASLRQQCADEDGDRVVGDHFRLSIKQADWLSALIWNSGLGEMHVTARLRHKGERRFAPARKTVVKDKPEPLPAPNVIGSGSVH
jgi:hypothetical protein